MKTIKGECPGPDCEYYRHYLPHGAPGEGNLGHAAYHGAVALCDQAQDSVAQWFKTQPVGDIDILDDPRGRHWWDEASQWEAKIRV